ncbi:MAG TPA: hypothetical protein VJN18_23280 [Polyangiaceae bacterium]|nr:hypothetical protein [Polyangiaceae bacterium]
MMRVAGLAWVCAFMLGCSDTSVLSNEPDLSEARAGVPRLVAAHDRGEALRRAADAFPRSEAPALFADSAELGLGSGVSADVVKRTLRLVDGAGHIQLPAQFVLNLTEKHRPRVNLQRYRRHGSGHEVWNARVEDPRTTSLVRYDNAIFVVSRRDNKLYGTVDVAASIFEIRPTTSGYTVQQSKRFDPKADCAFQRVQQRSLALEGADSLRTSTITKQEVALAEQDECGVFVLDVFFGFTQSAAAVVNDIEAHALLLTETANNGMFNSGIDDVRLRMVGAATTPWEPAGDGFDALDEALGIGDNFLQTETKTAGADFYAMIISQAAGSGLAYTPGHQSAVGPDTKAWRHEWGHNVGSAHCAPEDAIRSYAHGWDAGPGHATHMCGNEYNIFSTPLLTIDGFKMGDEAVADNTRLIRERAEEMAKRVDHVIPYEPCAGGNGGAAGAGTGGAMGGGVGGDAAGGTSAGAAGTGLAGTAGAPGVGGVGGAPMNGAGASTGGSSGAGGANLTSGSPIARSSGCSCAVPAHPSGASWLYGVFAALALGIGRKRLRDYCG